MPRASKEKKQPSNTINFDLPGYSRLPTILAVYPVCAATWWNLVRDGKAPRPVKLGPRTTAWKNSDIKAFLGDAA
jgi:prophage regulatory protein